MKQIQHNKFICIQTLHGIVLSLFIVNRSEDAETDGCKESDGISELNVGNLQRMEEKLKYSHLSPLAANLSARRGSQFGDGVLRGMQMLNFL